MLRDDWPKGKAVEPDGDGEPGALIAHVDDDSLWRILTARALHQRGHKVLSFDSAAALMADSSKDVPDLVMVDAVMPEVDGFELCERLRRHKRFADCPVLMLTSLDNEAAIAKAYESGATDVFVKSTQWTLLSQRVKHLCRTAGMQRELNQGHDWLAKLRRSSRVCPYDYDVRAREFRGPAGSFAMLGFDEDRTALSEAEFLALVPEERREDVVRIPFEHVTRGEPFSMVLSIESVAGRPMMVQIEGEGRRDRGGSVRTVRGLIRDVSDTIRAEQEIERLSRVDGLTGLPNRGRFFQICSDAIAQSRVSGRQAAVIVVDLYRFARINELLGQVAGDETLCKVGERLERAIGANRDPSGPGNLAAAPVLARMPGDEFAVLMPRVRDQAEVASLIEMLVAALKEPFIVAGTECFVSCCIGVALYPRDGDSAGLLLSRAGSALSDAKARGNRSVGWYVPPLKSEGRIRLQMLSGLHKALERGEFELHYQACIEARSGSVTGVEALARWRHEGVTVPPLEFIGLAEESGLIASIGEWAIDEASRQLRSWRDAGVAIPKVAVNISTLHFGQPSLVAAVRGAMRDHRLEPGMLELELTESCMVRDFTGTLGALHALRNLGVGLSLDDFGTGYSSLAYLSRLPIDKLKIDRSFVSLLGVSTEGEAIVRAIVALGQSLRLELVAEGVETRAQARRLLDIGCGVMQGFLLAPPVPAARIPAVVARARLHQVVGTRARSRGTLPGDTGITPGVPQ